MLKKILQNPFKFNVNMSRYVSVLKNNFSKLLLILSYLFFDFSRVRKRKFMNEFLEINIFSQL